MTQPAEGALSDRVHQASGMIAAQVDCGPGEGPGRLKIRAAAMDRTLDDMALDVLYRLIRFDG